MCSNLTTLAITSVNTEFVYRIQFYIYKCIVEKYFFNSFLKKKKKKLLPLPLKIFQLRKLMNFKPLKFQKSFLIEFFVPTFDTKVTEYLCSGGFFFSSDKFRLFN